MSNKIEIRLVRPEDNDKLAQIIRQVLTEFNANLPGTPFTDAKTDSLYETFQAENSAYFVALSDRKLLGGCGILSLDHTLPQTCELQKMYLLPQARGLKIGYQLICNCLAFAKQKNFKQCYLATFPTMTSAHRLYKQMGFELLVKPLTKSCHSTCHIWMLKQL